MSSNQMEQNSCTGEIQVRISDDQTFIMIWSVDSEHFFSILHGGNKVSKQHKVPLPNHKWGKWFIGQDRA